MTYFATSIFRSNFPGPFDVQRSSDGVDNTYEVYCLATSRVVTACHYWDAEKDARRFAFAIAAALNFSLHEDLVTLEGSRCLADFLTQYSGAYRIRRGNCDYHGGFWDIHCSASDQSLAQCYGGRLEYTPLIIACVIREALLEAGMYLPRDRQIGSAEQSELIPF
ncbi:MAG: hypothetical protein Aurels2KO_54810 [Aureliella sp.]